MIKNFNFYDVYGYFLPGLVLLTLTWVPFGVNGQHWPAKELAAALIAVPLAYVVGQVLQTLAALTMSARVKEREGEARYPSDLLLDEDDPTFSPEFRNRLACQIHELFKIDVKAGSAEQSKITRRRQDAFLLCRSTLIKSKAASYGEQFEGMYTFMRGLAGAFAFGSVYHGGWVAGDLISAGCQAGQKRALGTATVGLVLAVLFTAASQFKSKNLARFKNVWWSVGSLSVAIAATGYYLGSRINSHKPGLLFVVTLVTAFASIKCFASFKYFAQEFAKAIYRDFYNYQETRQMEKENQGKRPDSTEEDTAEDV